MSRSINLTGYGIATLSFWYVIPSIQPGNFDKCRVYIDSTLLFESTVSVTSWTQATLDVSAYAGGTHTLKFEFVSDASGTAEGWYLDDILVTAALTPQPPINDQCSGAIAMTAGTTYTVNTVAATAAGDPTPSCQNTFGKGVWFTFTPASSGPVTISTCGSDFDTVIQAYTGNCGALAAVSGGCGDDNGPSCTGSRASVTYTATAGRTYLILAGGNGGASGNLSILATGITPFTIIPTFDSSITSDPQAATIEGTINAAIAFYENSFSDKH